MSSGRAERKSSGISADGSSWAPVLEDEGPGRALATKLDWVSVEKAEEALWPPRENRPPRFLVGVVSFLGSLVMRFLRGDCGRTA